VLLVELDSEFSSKRMELQRVHFGISNKSVPCLGRKNTESVY
jgi:hypothetical protein